MDYKSNLGNLGSSCPLRLLETAGFKIIVANKYSSRFGRILMPVRAELASKNALSSIKLAINSKSTAGRKSRSREGSIERPGVRAHEAKISLRHVNSKAIPVSIVPVYLWQGFVTYYHFG